MTLTINSFKDIFLLIQSIPNLEYLNIKSCQPDANEHKISINKTNIKLKQLYLTLYKKETSGNFDQLTNCIKQFSSSLTCLSMDLVSVLVRNLNEIPFNSKKLQAFLESMTELRQLHLYARISLRYCMNSDEIVSRFKNQYWFDHNWLFGMHGQYFWVNMLLVDKISSTGHFVDRIFRRQNISST